MAKVSEDIDRWWFNTAVAACMDSPTPSSATGVRRRAAPTGAACAAAADALLLMLAPMAPHATAEAWEQRHGDRSLLHTQWWPALTPSWPGPSR